jgi:hypothetical protein
VSANGENLNALAVAPFRRGRTQGDAARREVRGSDARRRELPGSDAEQPAIAYMRCGKFALPYVARAGPAPRPRRPKLLSSCRQFPRIIPSTAMGIFAGSGPAKPAAPETGTGAVVPHGTGLTVFSALAIFVSRRPRPSSLHERRELKSRDT